MTKQTYFGELLGMSKEQAHLMDNTLRIKNGLDPVEASPKVGVFSNLCDTGRGRPYLKPASLLGSNIPDRLQRYDDYYGLPLEPYALRLVKARADVSRAFRLERITEEETEPFRIRVAWRLTRTLALITGLIDPEDPLGQTLIPTRDNPDPWTVPQPTPSIDESTRPGQQLKLIEGYLSHAVNYEPIALVPPKHEVSLEVWIEILEIIGKYLGVEQGSFLTPELGRLGFVPLVDPARARSNWPNRLQIVAWEGQIIEETADLVSRNSPRVVQKKLKEIHGLTPNESIQLVKMATALLREQSDMDIEDHRALMVARLEDFVDRSRQALNLRAELHGLKQLTIVHGLSRQEPEDAKTEFISIVRKLDQEDTEHNPVKSLTLDV